MVLGMVVMDAGRESNLDMLNLLWVPLLLLLPF